MFPLIKWCVRYKNRVSTLTLKNYLGTYPIKRFLVNFLRILLSRPFSDQR